MSVKTVLITGASSGIGRASALKLAADGHRVLATGRRTELLEQLAGEAEGTVVPLALDVRDAESIRALGASLEEHAPEGLDVLVNNAGWALSGPVETLPLDAIRAQFETNVFGLVAVTQAVLPAMRARRRGRVINVSSVVGRVTFPGMGVYGATKYAIEAISDALRMELGAFGISVVLVEPGFVSSEIGTASAHATAEHRSDVTGYERMQEAIGGFLESQIAKAISPAVVADVIARASTASRPRSRYVVPRSGQALIAVLNRLPTPTADKGKLKQAGLA